MPDGLSVSLSLSLTPFLSLFKLSDKMYAGTQVEGSDGGVGERRGGGGGGKKKSIAPLFEVF